MNKQIEKQINTIYMEVFKKVFNTSSIKDLSKNNKEAVMKRIELLEQSSSYTKFANLFAKELTKKGLATKRGVWRKYYNLAKKLHYVALPPSYTAYELQVYSEAVKQNFTMIKSIPSKMLDILQHQYVSTLIEEVAKGKRSRGSFQKEFERHGYKNARCIARTETSKLQTKIIETRALNVGSLAYVWGSSNDPRTRPSHRAMNGVVVFWETSNLKKPLLDGMRGNAGEFPNCRCVTDPIVDFDELTKSHYKVYDSSDDKIRTVTKLELINALRKRSELLNGQSK